MEELRMVRYDLIRSRCSKVKCSRELLLVMNEVKEMEYGDRSFPFSLDQLRHFSDTRKNRRHYRTTCIPKKRGGYRTITMPCGMLKSFQRVANRIFQAYYDAPPSVNGFIPGRSVVDNARIHAGMNYVFNSDLEDFFPSISQARVWKTLQSPPFCFPPAVASVLAGLCCTELYTLDDPRVDAHEKEWNEIDVVWKKTGRRVLPQGAPTSPILSNIVCRDLDRKLAGLARRFHVNYSRYADDITFSSQHNVYSPDGEFIREFRRIVASQGFTLNEAKTRLLGSAQRQEVTGLTVNASANVPRGFVRDLDNLLYVWERYGRSDAYAKFVSRYLRSGKARPGRYPRMENVIAGRLAYLRMVKGEHSSVWQRLDGRFRRLCDFQPESAPFYLDTWTISRFEAVSGFKLEMEKSEYGRWSCRFGPEGRKVFVCMSKWCRTRLSRILDSADTDALEDFKNKYQIGLCFEPYPVTGCGAECGVVRGRYFWMLFRWTPNQGELSHILQLKSMTTLMMGEECLALVNELGLKPVCGESVPIVPEVDSIKRIPPYQFDTNLGQLPF